MIDKAPFKIPPIVERFVENLLPVLLLQTRKVPTDQKREYVRLIASACQAYLNEDRPAFDYLLSQIGLSEGLHKALSDALWFGSDNARV